ncbi:MAG TPA: hypothetical protein VEU62_15330 [Bryobacterales bacterium]|nr:hypothetical protein [Bryobacterales bacterium]
MKIDLRRYRRSSLSGLVVLEWTDENQCLHSVRAWARNICRGGMMARALHPVPLGSLVRIRSKSLFFLAGGACVEHCTRWGFTYAIGLKFYNDLAERCSVGDSADASVEPAHGVSAPQDEDQAEDPVPSKTGAPCALAVSRATLGQRLRAAAASATPSDTTRGCALPPDRG